jgi:hypothetical protein
LECSFSLKTTLQKSFILTPFQGTMVLTVCREHVVLISREYSSVHFVLQVEFQWLLPFIHDGVSDIVWRVDWAPLGLHESWKECSKCELSVAHCGFQMYISCYHFHHHHRRRRRRRHVVVVVVVVIIHKDQYFWICATLLDNFLPISIIN